MSCWDCGYLKKEVRDGEEVYYCDDYDQVIDQSEHICESDKTEERNYDDK